MLIQEPVAGRGKLPIVAGYLFATISTCFLHSTREQSSLSLTHTPPLTFYVPFINQITSKTEALEQRERSHSLFALSLSRCLSLSSLVNIWTTFGRSSSSLSLIQCVSAFSSGYLHFLLSLPLSPSVSLNMTKVINVFSLHTVLSSRERVSYTVFQWNMKRPLSVKN